MLKEGKIKEGGIILTLQGKLKQKAIKQIAPGGVLHANEAWFFVDYASEEVPVNSRFDVLLKGETKQLVSGPGAFSIKLLVCLDQFANKLHAVPEGYKTICKFEFTPHIPVFIKNLPSLDEWDYNPEALSIADHKDIELAVPDLVLEDLYRIAFVQLKNRFADKPKHAFSKDELIQVIEGFSHLHPSTADNIIQNLMQLGNVTKNDKNMLELVDIA